MLGNERNFPFAVLLRLKAVPTEKFFRSTPFTNCNAWTSLIPLEGLLDNGVQWINGFQFPLICL